MCALREKMTSTIWSHEGVAKRTMFAHGPEMSTVPLEAQSLKTLSKMKQPRRILEIGMYTGYGASTMLKGCENATLASLEIDSFLKPWVRDGLASMPNLLSRREIEVGSALDTLEKMPSSEALDLVSIDANKNGYMRYVGVLIARGIPAKNAMTVDESTLKDCENETLVSLELDPFLKPWVQECDEFLQPFRDLRITRVSPFYRGFFLFGFRFLLAWVSSGLPELSSTNSDTGTGEMSLLGASSLSRT